jgi:hypothetical protein
LPPASPCTTRAHAELAPTVSRGARAEHPGSRRNPARWSRVARCTAGRGRPASSVTRDRRHLVWPAGPERGARGPAGKPEL